MTYNESIALINYAKDIDIEFNIKILLLVLTYIYCIAVIWLTFKWDKDKHYIKLIKNFLIRLPMMTILFFAPLYTIILFRTVSWEVYYGLMISFYSYSFIILMIAAKLGMFEYILTLLGFKYSPRELKYTQTAKKNKW
jgi:hypothetical protein